MAISFKEAAEKRKHFVCKKCGIDQRFDYKSQAVKAAIKHKREVHGASK